MSMLWLVIVMLALMDGEALEMGKEKEFMLF